MILSDADIVHFRNLESIDITPYNALQLQPASYDLTLAPYISVQQGLGWYTHKFDEHTEIALNHFAFSFGADETRTLPAGPTALAHLLMPNEFALFSTVETVRLDNRVAGQVMGKSTWARKGLIVESAGWVDPGFEGQLTLELKNLTNSPILLLAGSRIAQIVFMELRTNALVPYGQRGRYQGQRGPTPPRLPR